MSTIDVRHWWPEFIAVTREFEQIRKGYNKELTLCWDDNGTLNDNMYLSTMDADTCAVWEKMLGIRPDPDSTLEARRREVIIMSATSRPYTKKRLRAILDSYLGEGGYALTINTTLKRVVIDIKSAGRTDYIYDRVRQIIPADMELYVGDSYNRQMKLAEHTHQELAAYTHQQLREDTTIFE